MSNENWVVKATDTTMGTLKITVATTWQCSNEMRWLDISQYEWSNGGQPRVLQQKWVSNTCEVEWRDVPTVKDNR